jgi:hypothetical protein
MTLKKGWHGILSAALILLLSASSCSKGGSLNGDSKKQADTHKVIVNVCDKNTDKPLGGAKVYIVGDENCYTTDSIGNTKEIKVDVDKAYFKNYTEQVVKETGNGFVDMVVIKEGYAKHIELDSTIYPGDFPSVITVKMEPTEKDMFSLKQNYPDIDYVEKMMAAYESLKAAEASTQGDMQFVVTVKDGSKTIANAHVVIPEMGISAFTSQDGTYTFKACSAVVKDDYPVEKTYNEITILTYMEGYNSKAVFRVPVSSKGEANAITITLNKTEKVKIEEETIVPDAEWIESMVNYYNK